MSYLVDGMALCEVIIGFSTRYVFTAIEAPIEDCCVNFRKARIKYPDEYMLINLDCTGKVHEGTQRITKLVEVLQADLE